LAEAETQPKRIGSMLREAEVFRVCEPREHHHAGVWRLDRDADKPNPPRCIGHTLVKPAVTLAVTLTRGHASSRGRAHHRTSGP